ncbi:MAG TPA: hypothetical protein VN673_17840, partial [Clostridia bacterium]|nr:hypothetical protein [Clostridia bacterium]
LLPHLAEGAAHGRFTLACDPQSDLYLAMKFAGLEVKRHDEPSTAIDRAPAGSPVLILARHYPEKLESLPPQALQQAKAKQLRLYIEYTDSLPGLSFGPPRKTPWERLVISGENLGIDLPKGRILVAHDCLVLPVTAPNPLVVVARVAGYNHAVYGIPPSAQPVLFSHEDGALLVATTKLSDFRTGRFAPTREWQALWNTILRRLAGQVLPPLTWNPLVEPFYGPEAKLPSNYEHQALRHAAAWYYRSRLLVPESHAASITDLLRKGAEVTDVSPGGIPFGDGRFGILEGYSSNIRRNGDQPQRTVIRADCQAESAMVLAFDWKRNANRRSRVIASNLLDFLFFNSDLCQGRRGDPTHPAYGLVGWGSTTPAWTIANYGDDNARVMLATMLAGACLRSDRWDESLLRALFANLRTTGKLGFRGDRIDMPQLEANGWRHYHEAETVNYSPHFEAYNWACFLWAFRHTGYREFLDRSRMGIRLMMEAYPEKWRWDDNMERARMMLCLAWLIRLDDAPEYRGWLKRLADDYIAIQHATGALPERFRGSKSGSHYQVPPSNEAYGTSETPLLQENGDPVSDQLYLSGFALLGLHEAAAVLCDPRLSAMEDRLAAYLCRIQIRSKALPYLEGTWFRAFDFVRWEPWASSGDSGWGAWSTEAGWAQAWAAAILGLRAEKKTFWDFTAGSKIANRLPDVQRQMGQTPPGPWQNSQAAVPQK